MIDTKKLRQRILDLAIRGKLVPQDPNDEPASVLLDRIRAEKERLIAEGKIKRSKTKKSTTDDKSHYQQPFPIPDSWEWVRLEEILDLVSGQDFPPEKYNDKNIGIPYITGASNIENGHLLVNRWTQFPSVLSKENDLMVVCKGAGVGKMAYNTIGKVHIARQIQAIRDYSGLFDMDYIKAVIACNIDSIIGKANGLIPGLKRELLLGLFIPMPPALEQQRISKRIKELQESIDNLESSGKAILEEVYSAKSKILELAITGKLVPQNPDDEPTSELLKRINPKAEIVTDNEHYPQLPDNWCLVRLEDILDYEQPQAYIVSSTDYDDGNPTPVLTAGKSFIIGYTCEDTGIYNNLPCIIFDDFTTDSKYVDSPFKVKSSAMKILRPKGEVNLEYIRWFMSITRLSGDTHKRYWISEYAKIPIPLPPINEQNNIVMKISELFGLLDNIVQ